MNKVENIDHRVGTDSRLMRLAFEHILNQVQVTRPFRAFDAFGVKIFDQHIDPIRRLQVASDLDGHTDLIMMGQIRE